MRRFAPIAALAVSVLVVGCDQKDAATDAPSADNTRNNRDGGALPTPMDQGNDEKDLKITQAIRQAVMADGALSMDAKNCKVITNGGNVVLRGPVASAQERASIEAKARATADVAGVSNDLQVKAP